MRIFKAISALFLPNSVWVDSQLRLNRVFIILHLSRYAQFFKNDGKLKFLGTGRAMEITDFNFMKN